MRPTTLFSTVNRVFAYSLLAWPFSLSAQSAGNMPKYLDYTLPVQERVDDIVSRMTLEEKISQMGNSAAAIPRLNIPEYNWWNECLHGVARAGVATVFPQAIGLAATWDTPLMGNVADAISTEARAKNNDFTRKGEREIFKGLTFWSPNINIFRDPRWGRGQETYGEDPYLTARMGVAFVKGLQGNDPRYFKVIATPKHYAVHSGPEPDRHTFDAIIDNHDLYDTYLPAFEACVKEGGAFSVMCAYNRFMGDACCGSPRLLRKILRDDWGFKGYIVSDCGAISDIFNNHKIVQTAPEAAALAVKAGTDLNCGSVYTSALLEAVNKHLLTEGEIDIAVKRLYTAKFKLGMFDPPSAVPYEQIPMSENDSQAHRGLALQAARESIVLLKNDNAILPLSKSVNRVAVIGPTADSYFMLLGNYNGTPSRYVTPLQGIKDKVSPGTEVVYDAGCNLVAEGVVTHYLMSDMLQSGGEKGLRVEFFKNEDMSGRPYFSRIDQLTNPNWIYGTRIPSFDGAYDFTSVRWSGIMTAPETGEFNFLVTSDAGYRLFIGDSIVIESWANRELSTRNCRLDLKRGATYAFKMEVLALTRRPQFSVQWQLPDVDNAAKAVALAKESDVVIFVGGITSQLEGEEMRVDFEGFKGGDRTDLKLPAVQENLLKQIYSTGKPVVCVLTSGSALAVNWEKDNIPGIIQLWYPGEEGGTALADVLFGDYNPAGRLPVTFYKSVDQLPPFDDYTMKGRTYRYFTGEPLFSFGYGLSYTKFKYGNLVVPTNVQAGDSVRVSVEVQNVGAREGDEVAELYVKNLSSSAVVPIHALGGFARVHLNPGEKRKVEFVLRPRQLAVINKNSQYEVDPGKFQIAVGGVQPGVQCATTGSVMKEVEIVGERRVVD
ncbi:MAG TPA: glycoside hydrolase family 3 C-terminal domain-containing protein [Bacteroidota bacterium]|nr:glycoside hydrolase family 3 C-terminal domain-containing protein [Bacteroidota bacterium]